MGKFSHDCIEIISYGLNNDLFHKWSDSPITSTSDAVTSENYLRIISWVTKTPDSRQSTYHFIAYMFSSAKTRRNRKRQSVDSCALDVHGRSFDCGIVMLCVTHFWRHLTDCPESVCTLVTWVFPRSSNWLSLLNLRVRFRHFHCLACKILLLHTHTRIYIYIYIICTAHIIPL